MLCGHSIGTALVVALTAQRILTLECLSRFRHLDTLRLQISYIRFFSVREWRLLDHHHAHALIGYFDLQFPSALIVSYDGEGNDGTFNAYVGLGRDIVRVAQLALDPGYRYNMMGALLPEVTGLWDEHQMFCAHFDLANDAVWVDATIFYDQVMVKSTILSVAGKLMGYAATGEATGTTIMELPCFVRASSRSKERYGLIPARILRAACGDLTSQRSLAWIVQEEFNQLVTGAVESLLLRVSESLPFSLHGLVFTGGCALNVITNQLAFERFTDRGAAVSKTIVEVLPSNLRVKDFHVPPAPNDSGLSAAGLWSIASPQQHQQLQYLGFGLWDEEALEASAAEWKAVRLSFLGGVDYLAALLAGENRTRKPIVAVVRGRQEFGPRALGHRSLLALPEGTEIKDRLNRLKFRQWYRPVAPMIADEDLEAVFGYVAKSPYMHVIAPTVEDERLSHAHP
ncbi:Nodulation protein U [Symbiodinium microadriaticum]|uniref:Nodulation protein U n=1 Tax=Symbiodinium microadriaticum TaxID=2951 RepID=A0A1Q9DWP2_SYMMI|nr:Nodulation protein U [Symbiodinium microadriaticum]